MPIETSQARSPGWWLNRLLTRLSHEQPRYDMLDRYYRGENGIPIRADKATSQAVRRLHAMSRTNFAELVVEALRERVVPAGFRTGAQGDELGDAAAWDMWQANALDADSALVHRATFAMSTSHVIVGPVQDDTGFPLITPEDPRQVIAEHDPTRRRRSLAALKVFHDDVDGVDRAYLYLPGEVWRASRSRTEGDDPTYFNVGGFEWDSDVPDILDRPVVPVVEFPNRADAFGCTMGEFEPHLGILDRINYTILNRLEIATMQAFRQRAVAGALPTHDPATGIEIDYDQIFEGGPGALWRLPPDTKILELGQSDLGPLRATIRDDVQDLAAVTRTPLFYLTPEAANGSAEGASLAREGLVFKAKDRLLQLGESWEQVMVLAFLFAGDEDRANRADMEIIWTDPERFSLAARYDAAAKAQTAGVPWRTVMADVLQFSPQQVERMETERATDAFIASVAAPVAPTQQPAEAPVP